MADDVYFFMTRSDLRGVLAVLNEMERLQFVPSKRYSDPAEVVAYTLDDLPNLGVALHGSEMMEESVLLMPEGVAVSSLKIDQMNGTTSYLVGPSQNPDSLIMWPAGEFNENCIIRGRFGTSDDTPYATKLHRELMRVLKQQCVLAKKHFLGPEAVQRLRAGARLTHTVRASAEYDFRLPERQSAEDD
jgi:hypothetical protein